VNAVPAFSRRQTLAAVAALVLAGMAVYANTLQVPFFFDDRLAIVENPTIRDLSALGQVLSPPANGSGASGRPLVNLSLALNYAAGGTSVTGYHAVNLLLHVLAGLTLFGLVRRLLTGWRTGGREPLAAGTATVWALAVAGLWLVHPLQTETVTCVIQRTEGLLGLFYLLCLYAAVRGLTSPRPHRWYAVSVATALAGMATKEVMVTVPVVLLGLDRTFFAGSWTEAWRQRKGLYLGLAATWLLLGWLLLGTGGTRGTAAGFGLSVTPWTYALTQCEAIATYLGLSLWPGQLVVDYGTAVVTQAAEVIPQGLLVLALVIGTVVALRRRPVAGFLGAWFLVILSPSSSFVPLVSQPIAEHRMYLPLAAVVAAVVAALHTCLGRRGLFLCLALAVGLGARTVVRNGDYRSEISILTVTTAQRPDNARAFTNLGNALARAGRTDEALAALRTALRLKPDDPAAHVNLGNVYDLLQRWPEAETELREAVRLDPARTKARFNLGNVLLRLGKTAEAVEQLAAAVRLEPDDAEIRHNLGIALVAAGQTEEGFGELRENLRRHPAYARSRTVLQQLGGRP
jgi:tetratricopeptide (TPR) repeat protein